MLLTLSVTNIRSCSVLLDLSKKYIHLSEMIARVPCLPENAYEPLIDLTGKLIRTHNAITHKCSSTAVVQMRNFVNFGQLICNMT